MGLIIIPLIILLYWIVDKIEEKQGEIECKKYQEKLKEMGLKYYE